VQYLHLRKSEKFQGGPEQVNKEGLNRTVLIWNGSKNLRRASFTTRSKCDDALALEGSGKRYTSTRGRNTEDFRPVSNPRLCDKFFVAQEKLESRSPHGCSAIVDRETWKQDPTKFANPFFLSCRHDWTLSMGVLSC